MEAIVRNLALKVVFAQAQFQYLLSFPDMSNVYPLADPVANFHIIIKIYTIMGDIVNQVCCNFPFIAVEQSQEPTFRTRD